MERAVRPDGRRYRGEADRDAVISSGMEGGMQESMDALEQVAVSLA